MYTSILILPLFTFLCCFGLEWQGLDWTISHVNQTYPGPNNFASDNVWVDNETDWLHLTITNSGSTWYCAEIFTNNDSFSFGTYQWQIISPLKFNKNVVLGLTIDGGQGIYNRIDSEYTKWGNANNRDNVQFTYYPPGRKWPSQALLLNHRLQGNYSTQRVKWTSKSLQFLSISGHLPINTTRNVTYKHTDAPRIDHLNLIPQSNNMRIYMNLWLLNGNAPSDEQPVEVIFAGFQHQTIT